MTDHILGTKFNYQNFVPSVPVKKKVMCLRKLQFASVPQKSASEKSASENHYDLYSFYICVVIVICCFVLQ